MELCEQASIEQDPDKLIELVEEINLILEQRQEKLKNRETLNPDN